MDDLISRQTAIDRINKQREHLQPDIYPQDIIGDAAYRICAEFIERLPSAQPDQKKGKWIVHPEVKNVYGGTYIECSQCGEKYVVQHMEDEKYCRNCGAKMETEYETWNGICTQITAPKGTFDKIFNDNDTEDNGI